MLLAGLLILALCGPVWLRSSRKQLLLFAVDQSESIDSSARQQANEWLKLATKSAVGSGADVRFLPFDSTPRPISVDWPQDEQKSNSNTTQSPTAETDLPCPGTDLVAAIRAAAAAIPPSRVGTIFLLSDGNQTGIDSPISTASAAKLPVCTIPLPSRREPEVQLAHLEAPLQVRQGESFFLEVTVNSNRETTGFVDLYRGGIRIQQTQAQPVQIEEGETRFRFQQTAPDRRQETYTARLRGFEDTILDNNHASAIVYAQGRPRVLLLDSNPDQTDVLRWALDEQSIDVEARPAEGVPRSLTELQGYECLILSNVPATAMSARQMELIRLYVQETGGGLIMLGGDQSFGLGGYYRSEIDEILPVRSNFEKELEKPSLSMMLLIDRSGSMGGEKIELAKDAAKAAVELLGPRDSIGITVFDDRAHTVSDLQPTAAGDAILNAISSITASGGTNMYPAMVEARDALRNSSARLKHVILLSDGRSQPGDFAALAGEMASGDITLSTVALGVESSTELLEQLAQIGGGRYYYCDSAEAVPQVFARETIEASRSALNELPFLPQLDRPTNVLSGIDLELAPMLLGYVVTRPKPTAELILTTEAGDPLLTWWRYGLGMSVAFTSDAHSRWAAEWQSWPDFGPFWAQVVRHAMRKDDSLGLSMDVKREGATLQVIVDAISDQGDFLSEPSPVLTVIDPNLQRSRHAMRATAPGRFAAELPVRQQGAWHLEVVRDTVDETASRLSRGISVGYPDELRMLPTNVSILQQIADVSGGRYDTAPYTVADADERTARQPLPLWPWLLMAALLLFIVDVALRRLEFRFAGTL